MKCYATRVNLPRKRRRQRVRDSAHANRSILHLPTLTAVGGAANGPNATASHAARFGGGPEAKRSGGSVHHSQFKAGYNVVLTGGWSAQRVSRPVELDVGHARELAAKA